MSGPWGIVGCGRSKSASTAPAADLYTSVYIRAAVRWARSVTTPDRLLILSARHGLIPGTRVIAPYDGPSFAHSGYARREPTAARPVPDTVIAAQLAKLGVTGPVITLAGGQYYKRLRGAGAHPFNPFFPIIDQAGGDHRTGYQAQQFNAWAGRIPNERTTTA